MRVAIFGAGMTGLLAAKALSELNIEHTIFDKDVKDGVSGVKGLHYLHDNCGMPLEPHLIHNCVTGCNPGELPHLQYSRKLSTPENNSLVNLPAFNVVYDFQKGYNYLVNEHMHNIKKAVCNRDMAEGLLQEGYSHIISTIPLPIMFPEANCKSVNVEAMRGRPIKISKYLGLNGNVVVYNIDESTNWYRYSKVFGVEWTEVKSAGEFKIKKVVDTDFVSPDDRVILLGRWGAWDRKFLAHQAYYETLRRFGQ